MHIDISRLPWINIRIIWTMLKTPVGWLSGLVLWNGTYLGLCTNYPLWETLLKTNQIEWNDAAFLTLFNGREGTIRVEILIFMLDKKHGFSDFTFHRGNPTWVGWGGILWLLYGDVISKNGVLNDLLVILGWVNSCVTLMCPVHLGAPTQAERPNRFHMCCLLSFPFRSSRIPPSPHSVWCNSPFRLMCSTFAWQNPEKSECFLIPAWQNPQNSQLFIFLPGNTLQHLE